MLKKKNTLRNNKGFSLVELIVVIAIIGVLAAIAIPNVMGALQRSKAAADVASAATIASSIKVAIAEDKFTTTYSSPIILNSATDTIGAALVSNGYLDSIPKVQAVSPTTSHFYVSYGVGGSDMKIYVFDGASADFATGKAIQLYPSKVKGDGTGANAPSSALLSAYGV